MKQAYAGQIQALTTEHDRRAFSCGVAALDDYLQRYARQHAKAGLSRSYVACREQCIDGYYSLAMAGLRRDHLPAAQARQLPDFPLPMARLARLAVAAPLQGKGLGELLLVDALTRCVHLADSIGMLGVLIDAKDEQARRWYQRYEFAALPDQPLTLWLPAAAIRRLLGP